MPPRIAGNVNNASAGNFGIAGNVESVFTDLQAPARTVAASAKRIARATMVRSSRRMTPKILVEALHHLRARKQSSTNLVGVRLFYCIVDARITLSFKVEGSNA